MVVQPGATDNHEKNLSLIGLKAAAAGNVGLQALLSQGLLGKRSAPANDVLVNAEVKTDRNLTDHELSQHYTYGK